MKTYSMKILNRANTGLLQVNTERVLQFGGGNFMRGFVDWMLDVYNKKENGDFGVLLVATRGFGSYIDWQQQDGLYHILTRGYQNGQTVDSAALVSSVSRILNLKEEWDSYLKSAENPAFRFIFSNTTEAGIKFSTTDNFTDIPPVEFPAKLTIWLYHRYQFYNGAADKGCIIIPVELIDNNGDMLKKCILQNADNWNLDAGFTNWIEQSNTFCNTLVDRIVPGIRENIEVEWDKIGFIDKAMTQGEAFHFFAIEAPDFVQQELPLDKVGLNVVYTNDLTPYRTRKVRILNGAHTAMVPVSYLYGIETVKETVEHEVLSKFVQQCMFDEIIPTLDLPDEELQQFANDVLDRFMNPFIRHELISISLNSISKFKTRILPSILEYQHRNGEVPQYLVFSMAAMIHFYKGDIPLNDDQKAIDFIQLEWKNCDKTAAGFSQMSANILGWEYGWNTDLTKVNNLQSTLATFLFDIEKNGMKTSVDTLVNA